MANLEKIIRPFQTRDITPAKPVMVATGQVAPENVVLLFGVNGSGRLMHGSSSYNRTEYQDRKPRELFGHGKEISFQFPPITFP